MRSIRVEFSPKTKARIIARATRDGVRYCESCGQEISGSGDVDHIVPEWTRSATARAERKRLDEGDGWLLCEKCHDAKTKREAFERAKTDRIKRNSEKRLKPKPPRLRGGGFCGWRNFKGEAVRNKHLGANRAILGLKKTPESH